MPDRFQFSIRSLLAVIAAVAAGTAVARAEPSIVTVLGSQGLTLLFATMAVVGACQTTGNMRAFWVGCAIVLCPLTFWVVEVSVLYWPQMNQPGSPGSRFEYFVVWPEWCAIPVNGLLAVCIHWIFSPHATTFRLPRPPLRPTIIALALFPLLLLLGAAFFGGMLFGERHERDRRDQEEVDFERKWTLPVETAY